MYGWRDLLHPRLRRARRTHVRGHLYVEQSSEYLNHKLYLLCFTVFFWFGRNRYKKTIPERNIVTLFFKCSWVSEFIPYLKLYILPIHLKRTLFPLAARGVEAAAPGARLPLAGRGHGPVRSADRGGLQGGVQRGRALPLLPHVLGPVRPAGIQVDHSGGHISRPVSRHVSDLCSRRCVWTGSPSGGRFCLTRCRWQTPSSSSSASPSSTRSSTPC